MNLRKGIYFLLQLYFYSAVGLDTFEFDQVYEDAKSIDSKVKIFQTDDHFRCLQHCVLLSNCTGINYNQGEKICELLTKDNRYSQKLSIIGEKNWIHFGIKMVIVNLLFHYLVFVYFGLYACVLINSSSFDILNF